MIVVTRGSKTVVLTGWRAAAVGALAMACAWLAFAVFAFILLGVALTLGAALLLIVPALAVVATIAYFTGRKELTDRR
jgi:hypothetical protein